MILARLKEYADTRMKLPPEMYGESPVRWIIDLNADGSLLGFVSRGGDNKASMRGLPMTVPQQNVNRTMNIKANLLVDNGEYVLGLPGADSNSAKVADRHQAFKELARNCAEETCEPSVEAVSKWLENWTLDRSSLPEQFDAKQHKLTFRVDGAFPADLDSVREFWAARTVGEGAPIMTCLVTGLKGPVQRRMPAHIEGLKRIGGEAKTALVSANKKPFESYGLEESLTSPISREAAERFTKALNELISKQDSHIYVGPLVYVFWTREETSFNFLGMVEQPKPEAVRLLFKSPISGQQTSDVRTNGFYALALSAKKTRATVRDWLETTVPDVKGSLRRWFEAQEIVDAYGDETRPLGLYALAASVYRDASKEMQPAVSAAMMRVALKGGRLPDDLLARAVRRCVVGTVWQDGTREHVTMERAALIKLILTTQDTQERLSMSDMKSLNEKPSFEGIELAAYNCGRLLAQLEAVQIRAQGRKVNTTVIDRYYGAASTTPSKVIGLLMSNAQDHLSKIRKKNRGAYEGLQRRIEEIMQPLKKGYPNTLNMSEQGLFALGYYHQRAQNRADIKSAGDRKSANANGEES